MSDSTSPAAPGDASPLPQAPRRRFLSFNQLTALAIAGALVASGMVPVADLAFALLSFLYLHLLSAVAFPPLRPVPDPPVFGPRNRLLAAYVSAGAVVGLLLPLAHILYGVRAGEKRAVNAAAPHVFLLTAQIFLEGVAFAGFSLPIRAFVPICYNTKRLFTISEWVAREFRTAEGAGAHGAVAGRALAVANLGFWAFNLLGFLLPVYLPRALKNYYSGYNKNNNNNNNNNNNKAREE